MKIFRLLQTAALITAALTISGCTDNNGNGEDTELTYNYTFETQDEFTKQGYWVETFNPDVKTIGYYPFLVLTHSAQNNGGIKYWDGFTPVRASDNADHAGDWADYVWGSAAGGGYARSQNYVLGKWNDAESYDAVPKNPVCGIYNQVAATPLNITICNSSYVYHTMMSEEFALTSSDYLRLVIKGVDSKGEVTGTVVHTLAENGVVKNQWEQISLSVLGKINMMYIQIESNRQFGETPGCIPPYFCIDNLQIYYLY